MNDHDDPVLRLLFQGLVIFAALLLVVAWFLKESPIFQVFAGLVTGFGASFFTRIKERGKPESSTPPSPQA